MSIFRSALAALAILLFGAIGFALLSAPTPAPAPEPVRASGMRVETAPLEDPKIEEPQLEASWSELEIQCAKKDAPQGPSDCEARPKLALRYRGPGQAELVEMTFAQRVDYTENTMVRHYAFDASNGQIAPDRSWSKRFEVREAVRLDLRFHWRVRGERKLRFGRAPFVTLRPPQVCRACQGKYLGGRCECRMQDTGKPCDDSLDCEGVCRVSVDPVEDFARSIYGRCSEFSTVHCEMIFREHASEPGHPAHSEPLTRPCGCIVRNMSRAHLDNILEEAKKEGQQQED